MQIRARKNVLVLIAAGLLLSTAMPAVPARASVSEPLVIGGSGSGWQMQTAASATSSATATATAETGAQISAPDYRPANPANWHPAIVPGTVLTTLVAAGVYPDPMFGENNRPNIIPETLNRQDYWYRATFTVPAAYAGKKIWLNFDGINYAAAIWVNGAQAGSMRGAFARGKFDITPLVAPGKPAALAVLVSPQPHPGTPHEHTLLAGMGRNGGITALDGPAFLCSIGWDWIPAIRDRCAGIWQKVFLTATGPVLVENPLVTSEVSVPDLNTADLAIEVTLRNVTAQPQHGVLKGRGGCMGAFGEITDTGEVREKDVVFEAQVELPPNSEKIISFDAKNTPALHIFFPKLWWPNGYGPQNLHTLRLSFETTDGALSDQQDVTFGIRQIAYEAPGSDNLALVVNGVRVFCRGGNWGMDDAMKRNTRERLEAQLRMHQQAHYTMLRNWVGQSTNEDLYQLCDQYGILIWDEFFQPNPSDGNNPADIDTYIANVREKILRYRNHPSIALWCARNEGYPPPEIDARLRVLLKEIDPKRHYQPSSTEGGGVHSGGPYGAGHPPRDYYDYTEAFKTEIGSASIPTIESIQGMMPRADWETINDDWAEHDLARGASGGEAIRGILEDRYGKIANLADFVRKAQLLNYETHRAIYESRLARMFTHSNGVLLWMSHPAQPSFVWQLYHHDLEPNATLFAVQNACEPLHIMLNEKTGHIMIVNHTTEPIDTTLLPLYDFVTREAATFEGDAIARVRIYNLDGTLVSDTTLPVEAPASAVTDLGEIKLPSPEKLSPVYFVKLTLAYAQRNTTPENLSPISENLYWHAADPARPDDLRALDKLPAVMLDATVRRRDAGGKTFLDVTLRNPAATPALMAHLQLHRQKSDGQPGERVLPTFYTDNYISLMPGESRAITIEAAQSDLKGDSPLVLVDGWNINVRPTSQNSGLGTPDSGLSSVLQPFNLSVLTPRLALNENAQVSHWPETGLPIKPSDKVYVYPPSDHYAINCGGSDLADGAFTADICYQGGAHRGGGKGAPKPDIDRRDPLSGPDEIYETQRTGDSAYVLPMKPGVYTVRLHFVSTFSYAKPGNHQFDVQINGHRVLAGFDIFKVAKAKDKSVVREFSGVKPDADGNIEIRFRASEGVKIQPQINAIEVIKTGP